jgi:copper homeostasis protein
MSKVILEICCSSLEDALEAQAGGADRVELCSALELEGLTPSPAAITQAESRLRIPYVCMIRPRPGNFFYSNTEFKVMQEDARFALDHGAAGIVFGILNPDGTVDVPRCRTLAELAGKRETVFHRAFDLVPDPIRALDELIRIGITRVLTSGQCNTAAEGSGLIRSLIEHAGGRIEILPAGNIRPENVRDLLARTGCQQVHLAARKRCEDLSVRNRDDSGIQVQAQSTDGDLVARMARLLRA